MSVVKARVKCIGVNHPYVGQDDFATITLIPVWNDGKGNESWSKATPSGKIELNVTNPAAIEQFTLGSEYELTFEAV